MPQTILDIHIKLLKVEKLIAQSRIKFNSENKKIELYKSSY